MSVDLFVNPGRLDGAPWPDPPDLTDVLRFHRRLPGYAPTPLVDAPSIADRLGVASVQVKAETSRLGLPSFKILGASWATYRAVVDHVGHEPQPWTTIDELARQLAPLKPFALATATDGNHGRAVAFMARLLGFDAHIFVPAGTADARMKAIRGEGATLTIVEGDYDAAVARAAQEASERCLVISDTSWPGYEATPRRVIEGYSTIFYEIDAIAAPAPTAVVVPVGVGALMAATVRHYGGRSPRPLVIGVEPSDANCVLESVRAGHMITVPGPHRSVMVGMNCGTPSPVAWAELSTGVDSYISITDDWAHEAVRALAKAGIEAGETGAASTAAMLAIAGDASLRQAAGLGPDSRLLLLCTEGPTGR